jgi:HEAT repeats/Bacterial SH3 domain
MEEQDKRIEEQTNGDGAGPSRAPAEETQVGQAMETFSRATRQLTTSAPAPSKRAIAQAANAALRDRIGSLITALGDPANPLHHQAVDDLVAIGAPAVPALNDGLGPHRPWLTAYRAAEALGQIGDGRAAGPLLDALRHPNSNVRWSAVRALAVVGDARALLELRRVARDDQGKTSWGESVGGAAQSVLDQMQSHNMLLRGADLIKTTVACVLMLVALILAWSVVNTLRAELRQVGHDSVPSSIAGPPVSTAQPTAESGAATVQEFPTAEPTATPPVASTTIVSGTALVTGNVRARPTRDGQRVGGISEGDEIIFLAATSDRVWYLVRLGERHAATSRIDSDDGTGWVNRSLLSEPQGDLPVEEPPPKPEPTLEPAPTPEPTTAP